MSQRTTAEALMVVATMIWGATFVVVKAALESASPLVFIAIRFTLAGLLLVIVLGRGRMERQGLLAGLVLGVFLFGGYCFQTWGLVYTTPPKSAFITGFGVILVPFIQVVQGFRVKPATVGCAVLGLAGLYLLVLPSGLDAVNRGDVLTLVASVSFAFHIVWVGAYTRKYRFFQLVAVQILTVGLLAAAALPLDPNPVLEFSPGLIGALLGTAVLGTAFAFSIQNWAQKFTPPAHTALILTLEPVFAALTSWLVAGERFGGKALMGSALILTGMAISELWGSRTPSPAEG